MNPFYRRNHILFAIVALVVLATSLPLQARKGEQTIRFKTFDAGEFTLNLTEEYYAKSQKLPERVATGILAVRQILEVKKPDRLIALWIVTDKEQMSAVLEQVLEGQEQERKYKTIQASLHQRVYRDSKTSVLFFPENIPEHTHLNILMTEYFTALFQSMGPNSNQSGEESWLKSGYASYLGYLGAGLSLQRDEDQIKMDAAVFYRKHSGDQPAKAFSQLRKNGNWIDGMTQNPVKTSAVFALAAIRLMDQKGIKVPLEILQDVKKGSSFSSAFATRAQMSLEAFENSWESR